MKRSELHGHSYASSPFLHITVGAMADVRSLRCAESPTAARHYYVFSSEAELL